MKNCLPLPGNLPRSTTFDCVARYHPYFYGDAHSPSIFAGPERSFLRRLMLSTSCIPLDSMNTQDLEEVSLIQNIWYKDVTFISRCHSLSTLVCGRCDIILDQSRPPFTLPKLTDCDAVVSPYLRRHTPRICKRWFSEMWLVVILTS